MADSSTLRIGTRGSPLALAQTGHFIEALKQHHASLAKDGVVELVAITTTGDRVQDVPLAALGGKGLFTREIDSAMLAGQIDIAIHSMKDIPSEVPAGLALHAVMVREDPRDAFISPKANSLAELPEGARVGTSSLRRQALILHRRPDLRIVPFRGNVDTRLKKLAAGEADATLLASAGLKRLGREDAITSLIEPEELLPAVAQGALAATCRADDRRAHALLAPIIDAATTACIMAERAMLAVLEGSCHTPIAGLAEMDGTGMLTLRAAIAYPGGAELYETVVSGPAAEAEKIGGEAAQDLLAKAGPALFDAIREDATAIIRPHPEMDLPD